MLLSRRRKVALLATWPRWSLEKWCNVGPHCLIASSILSSKKNRAPHTYRCFSGSTSDLRPRLPVQETWDLGWIDGSGRSPGGGRGNPFLYSCLENRRDRGAWWAAVHRVKKSWTWLKWLSTHMHPHITLTLKAVGFLFQPFFLLESASCLGGKSLYFPAGLLHSLTLCRLWPPHPHLLQFYPQPGGSAGKSRCVISLWSPWQLRAKEDLPIR